MKHFEDQYLMCRTTLERFWVETNEFKVKTTFVPGRSIGDNILMVQELLHRYHIPKGPARCALKVDLSKAYDLVDWDFLLYVMHRMNSPPDALCLLDQGLSVYGSFLSQG